jgi:hypothetical protein
MNLGNLLRAFRFAVLAIIVKLRYVRPFQNFFIVVFKPTRTPRTFSDTLDNSLSRSVRNLKEIFNISFWGKKLKKINCRTCLLSRKYFCCLIQEKRISYCYVIIFNKYPQKSAQKMCITRPETVLRVLAFAALGYRLGYKPYSHPPFLA